MWKKLLCVALICVTGSAWAADNNNENNDVIVQNAWVGETVPGQTTASVQMDVTCASRSGKLVAADSPVADSVEVQRLWPSNGRIKMVKVGRVRLPRGRPVEFGDRGMSLMLLGLKQPLKQGDQVPVNLTVMLSNGDKVTVATQVEVKPLELSYKHYGNGEVQDAPSE
jgi:copper(I)-binding protein